MDTTPLASPPTLPRRADVVIAGGGIMGCATAYYLAKAGMKPLVIDRSRLAGQQSSRAWGFVRQQSRDPAEVPLARAAIGLWRTLSRELQCDLQWQQGGSLFLAHTQDDLAAFERWLPIARDHDLDTRLLTADEVRQVLPGISGTGLGATYTPSDGQAEPKLAAAAFAARARELGAVFLEGCGLTGVDVAGGAVSGVQTELGDVRTSQLVVAAGASSWRVLRHLGIEIPQQVVRGTVARTSPVPLQTPISFIGHGLGFRQRPDGSFNIADDAQADIDVTLDHLRGLRWYLKPFLSHHRAFRFHVNGALVNDLRQRLPASEARSNGELLHVRDPKPMPSETRVARSLASLHRALPETRNARVVESWAGGIDVLPDGIPIIDAPSAHPGLLVATGFCGHGFALGPIVGKVLADWVTSGSPGFDLKRLRLSRYAEGDVQLPYSLF